ncbi:hypothetical protein LOTGIDRAFT_232186 [Lottia gigantea]|uniref:MYND-type domain-containing protein n=1 Tax=Lottia gigantea TaxID=225164 RepID=V4AK22_LOTGI|nr:hypothetical protein LOTGIDRAFT_232186 [Lottia gigantea]ESO95080.1 hypothetical protein LOTGIDRAFT_232186 [Lottia gigantea]
MGELDTKAEIELRKLENDGQILFENQNYEEAREKYSALIAATDVEDPHILLKRARCHMNLNDYQSAYADAKHAYKINPKSLEACILCGQASTQILLFEEALNYFNDGLKIDPKNKTITLNLKNLHSKILSDYNEKGKGAETTYSAVKFCTQDPYPGDSDLLNLEYEILAKKYKIPSEDKVNFDAVNKEEAAKHAALAFRLRNQDLSSAIHQCTLALSNEPPNLIYRQLRADMYLEKGDHVKALSDMWAIPKQNRGPDIWKAGGKVLMSLELPISAEFWFRRATKLSKEGDDEAAMLFQQVRVDRLYRPLTAGYPVKVEFKQFGRGVYATEDIKEGDIAFVDSPVVRAMISNPEHKIEACSHCARSLLTAAQYFGDALETMTEEEKELVNIHWPDVTPIYCDDCRRVKYCSDDCRLEAWDLYHQIICPKLNPASSELYDLLDNEGWGIRDDGTKGEIWGGHYSLMILANIWASIIMEAKRLMITDGATTATVTHWAKAKAPYRRFIAYGTTSAISRMPHMLPVFRRVFKNSGHEGVVFNVTEEEFNGRYYQATCNLQEFSARSTPYHAFMKKLSTDLRGFQMIKYLEKSPPYAGFCGMFPLHACLNHSCCNNVEIRDGDCNGTPGVNVVAKRFIKTGEELFTSYIDNKLSRNIRRAWLYKSFNFWCQCPQCTFEGEDKKECTNCNAKSESEKAFPCCSKCKRAWYCSVKCQKEAWRRGHKNICSKQKSGTA